MAPERTDRAWSESILRPLPELTETWPRILAAVDALAVDPATPFGDLTPRARYLLGVHAGAAWCLGATKRAPMSWDDLPVSYGTIAEEQAAAAEVARTLHNGSEDYARGVLRWTYFLLGFVDDLDLAG